MAGRTHASCHVASAITAILLLCCTAAGTSAATKGEALLAAAAKGDSATVRDMIAGGASLDPKDRAGRTPLLLAVEHNKLDVARLLIAAGANINAIANNRDTPWLLAGARGRTQMLRLMADKGPDLKLRNRYGGTALVPACHYGHVEAVAFLLTTKIKVDSINDLGWTCLLEAVILGDGGPRHVEIVRRVLAAGADPNIADREGVSPLKHAKSKGQTEVARLIAAAGGK